MDINIELLLEIIDLRTTTGSSVDTAIKARLIQENFDVRPKDHIGEVEKAKTELIELLFSQVADLTMMSKIELGDDVIEEIRRLKTIIN